MQNYANCANLELPFIPRSVAYISRRPTVLASVGLTLGLLEKISVIKTTESLPFLVHPKKLIPSLPAHPHPPMNPPSPYAQPAVFTPIFQTTHEQNVLLCPDSLCRELRSIATWR